LIIQWIKEERMGTGTVLREEVASPRLVVRAVSELRCTHVHTYTRVPIGGEGGHEAKACETEMETERTGHRTQDTRISRATHL
jgi:hypothetical protein